MKKFFALILAVCAVTVVSIPAFAASDVETPATNTTANQMVEDDQQSVQPRGPYKGMVLYNGVNIRSGPVTQYPSYGHMNKGDIVWIYNYDYSPWVYVLCDTPHKGQFAYIHGSYITEIPD